MDVSADILNGVILGHRDLISERYDYANLSNQYELPPWLKEKAVIQFKDYFLEYIYPTLEKRAELNDAFSSLEGHISNPQHLMLIFLDSGSLLFKYGRYLPRILNAGLKAMGTFRIASKVEYKIAETAHNSAQTPPYSINDITHLITRIPRSHLDNLIDNVSDLYEVLKNEKLVNKIIEVVEHLIKKMEGRPNVYSTQEIAGIELGREIIEGSRDLFYQFDKSEREFVVQFIIDIERDAIEKVYR